MWWQGWQPCMAPQTGLPLSQAVPSKFCQCWMPNSPATTETHSLAGGWQTDDTITLPPWRRQWCIPAGIYTYSGYGFAFALYHQILPPMPSPSLCRCNLTVLPLGSGPGHLLLPSSVLFCPCSMRWTLGSISIYVCTIHNFQGIKVHGATPEKWDTESKGCLSCPSAMKTVLRCISQSTLEGPKRNRNTWKRCSDSVSWFLLTALYRVLQ